MKNHHKNQGKGPTRIKPFLIRKGFIGNNDIIPTHKNKIIADEKQLAELFNKYYINYVEKCSGIKPRHFNVNFENTIMQSIKDIVNCYENPPSIIKITQAMNGSDVPDSEKFSFKTVNELKLKTF